MNTINNFILSKMTLLYSLACISYIKDKYIKKRPLALCNSHLKVEISLHLKHNFFWSCRATLAW